MDTENIRKLQLITLEILKEFIKICDTHNLKYYAIAGTALGAVRHQGFIPWDDDIDVSMPREDYEKFIKVASKDLSYNYEIRTIDECDEHSYPVSIIQIIDKRFQVIIGLAKEKVWHNPFFDIFPTDGLPDSKILRYFHVRLFLIKKMLYSISVFDTLVKQNKKRPFYERLIIKFCNRFNISKLFNKKKRVLAGDKLLKKYTFKKTKYCSPQLWGQYKLKAVFPTDWIGDGVLLPFEDIQIVVPANYKKYLEQLYGSDYMELPPEEKRVTHASKIIFNNGEVDNEKI